MGHLIGSSIEVPAHHLVRNVTVQYAHWWHKVVGTACGAVHISRPLAALKRKGTTTDPPLFGKSPPSRGGKRRGGRKRYIQMYPLLHLYLHA